MKKCIVAAVLFGCMACQASAVLASDSARSLSDQVLARTLDTNKVVRYVPPGYSVRSELLAATSEIQQIVTKSRDLSEPRPADMRLLRQKLATLKILNGDLRKLATEKEDEATVARAMAIDILIRKMAELTKRLEAAIS